MDSRAAYDMILLLACPVARLIQTKMVEMITIMVSASYSFLGLLGEFTVRVIELANM